MEFPTSAKLHVLSTLSSGERNLSDLSRIVGKDKSTVLEHLELLVTGGFVERKSTPGMKWVFYNLTSKGRELLGASSVNRYVLVSSLASLAAAAYLQFSRLVPQVARDLAESAGVPAKNAAPLLAAVPSAAPLPPAAPFSLLAVSFLALGMALGIFWLIRNKRIDGLLRTRPTK